MFEGKIFEQIIPEDKTSSTIGLSPRKEANQNHREKEKKNKDEEKRREKNT